MNGRTPAATAELAGLDGKYRTILGAQEQTAVIRLQDNQAKAIGKLLDRAAE